MGYKDEFGGYSPGEDRAPWELTPAQAWREWRSCRKVDAPGTPGAARCSVLEENKAEHARSHARRAEEQKERRARLEEERRQAKARLEALRKEAHEARQSKVRVSAAGGQSLPRTEPPTEERESAASGRRTAKGKGRRGISLFHIIVLFLLVGALVGTGWNLASTVGALRDKMIAGEGGDDDFYQYYESASDAEEEEQYELEHYEGDSSELAIALSSSAGREALSYQSLYEKCRPSMVSITVVSGSTGSTGSGIVLTEDGYILTCDHVVDNGERCTVLTADNQRYQAKLVGTDPETDLAVLKIEANGLTPAEFGDADELRVGDEALAIGDPLGESFRATMTNGIVSGINRSVSSRGHAMTLIQTTAPVNSGNSGGALFNIYGQVVGVVNLKIVTNSSSEATVEGMGMAVPSTTVQTIVSALGVEGTVHRPVLGITCTSIDADAAEANGIPAGLLVQSVNEGSDCYVQGLEVYDIITAANGQSVCTVEEFRAVIDGLDIGDSVAITVYRDTNQVLAQESGENQAPSDPSYDYQYYGELEVTLMDSIEMS